MNNDWCENRLADMNNYDEQSFNAKLTSLETLQKSDFSHALCRFIPEITKAKMVASTLVRHYMNLSLPYNDI